MKTFLGIVIPFLGTTLGAACVFFMKKSLGNLVQRALAGITEDANRGYWAIDKILCGNLDDALDRIPEEDGTVSDLGASEDAFAAFLEHVAEEATAKN